MAKKTIKDVDLKDKKVLVRVDFNVPLKDGVITNDNRIVAALPTIKYVIENGGKAILFSHLGRVKTEEDKAGKSLKPVAERLSELLGQPVTFVPETRGKELEDAVNNMKDGDVLVFENTRFEDVDGKKESGNDAELGKYWASLGDVFVNDAFGTAHRAHASNVGIASTGIPTVAGFLMEKAANESYGYNTDEIVSSDIVGMTYGSLFDATQTKVMTVGDKQLVKTVAWYDNEMSYTAQLVRTLEYFANL